MYLERPLMLKKRVAYLKCKLFPYIDVNEWLVAT